MSRLWEMWDLEDEEGPRPRGVAGQEERRALERTTRMRALAFARWAQKYGLGTDGAAAAVGLMPRTLREWQESWRTDRLKAEPRGRPAERADPSMRDTIVAMFHLMGPGVGLRTLQALFPETARRELEDMLRRYRDVYLTRTSMLVHVLRWRKAGAVWAMDFTQPPTPVEGKYEKILVVRDLSSWKSLLALPVEEENAKAVKDALISLFLEFGAPLVIKCDNGSPFIAEETRKLLEKWQVFQLLSPPGTPEYNGSCEAGIGGLKTRAHHESARNDRPGEWTCDDVEAARLMANQTGRPWGATGVTPDEAWSHRRPIDQDDRGNLSDLVEGFVEEARVEQGYLPGLELGPAACAAVHRVAISRALVAYGILEFRRRRIPLAI